MKLFMAIVNQRRRELLVLWGIFALLVISQSVYIYRHEEPFTFLIGWKYFVGFMRYMIAPWLVTFLIVLCGYILGRVFIRLVASRHRFRTDLEESIFSIGIGVGIVALLTFLLGLARLLYPFLFGFVGLIILTAGFRHLLNLFGVIRRSFRPLEWDLLDYALLILIGAFVLSTILRPNNPSLGWDAMHSHLAAPKFYLRDHAVSYMIWMRFNSFPQLQEMLFTVAMMFFKDPGASLPYGFMLGSALIVYMTGSRYFDRRAGLIGAAIFLLMPEVFRNSQAGYVEHALVFFTMLSMYGFLRWYETRRTGWLVLLGAACGLSCGVKYLGLVSSLFMLILVAIAWFFPMPKWEIDEIHERMPAPSEPEEDETRGKKRRKPKKIKAERRDRKNKKPRKKRTKVKESSSEPNDTQPANSNPQPGMEGEDADREPGRIAGLIRVLGIALLWMVILGCAWYVRNIVLFGNPFFPFMESIFGGLGLGTLNDIRGELAVNHSQMLKYFHIDLKPYSLIALPWNSTFYNEHPSSFFAPSTVGPFLLALTPTVFFVRKWRRAGLMLIVALVLFYGYWFFIEGILYQRYLISMFPVHCLIAAWGVSDVFNLRMFDRTNRAHMAWVMLIVAFGLMFFVKTTTKGAWTGRNLAFADEEARDNYLARKITGWAIIDAINDHIARGGPMFNEDTRIYGVAVENRRYYFDCKLIGDPWTYANYFEFMEHAGTGKELYEWLKSHDIDYLLFSGNGATAMSYVLDLQLPRDETFDEYFEELATWEDYQLFNLLEPGEMRTGPITGEPPAEEEVLEPALVEEDEMAEVFEAP